MWPFEASSDITVENEISTHEAAGYTIDGLLLLAIIIVIIIWRWRRNARRIQELEDTTRRVRLNQSTA